VALDVLASRRRLPDLRLTQDEAVRQEAGPVSNIGLFGAEPNPRFCIDKTVIGAAVTTWIGMTWFGMT
jgi:hypothetical protein